MSKELAYFKNFAKLKNTKVAFNDITVITGKPETGKSYVMKFIYAVNELVKLEDNNGNEFYLKNLLNSIFANQGQISDIYKIVLNDISIEYENNYFKIDKNKILTPTMKQHNKIIYIETSKILDYYKFMNRHKGKTPFHIESLLNILDTDYSYIDKEEENFIQHFRKKTIKYIGGVIENSGDSFTFNNTKSYDILNISSDIKSIGLIQFLVTNKALKKGSVLYWEEPESHLHPEWQLKLIDLFIELMNAGVKIVFSTHSPYMPDYLNAISKRKGFEDRVSFNLFKEKEGVVENHILDTDEKWQMVQDELLGSFEDILWKYI